MQVSVFLKFLFSTTPSRVFLILIYPHCLQNVVPVGLQREFVVLEVDGELGNGRQGKPVLSARAVDKDVLWRRLEQMHGICAEVNIYYDLKHLFMI
jgi:hypothetical protein